MLNDRKGVNNMKDNLLIVGKRYKRKDVIGKVTGSAIYASDVNFDGQLLGGVLRSPHAFATVLSVDTTDAENIPGVHAVMTSKDIPGSNSIGVFIKDEFVLAENVVRRIGDAVAIVAAESPETLNHALDCIKVTYNVHKPILSVEEAMCKDAAKIHDSGNILMHKHFEQGNVDEAFAKCDVIVENRYTTPLLTHMFLETEAGTAREENGIMTIYSGTQYAHYFRNEVANVLGLPMNKVRVVQTTTGGAFGAKNDISVQAHIALLAQKTGRPVKMVRTREESTLVSTKRHPFYIDAKTGATKDGKVLACEVKMVADTGAYSSSGPSAAGRAIMHFMGPYEVPNVRGDLDLVYTNNPIAGAFRGFGVPQVAICHEGQMNALARKLNMDAIELRLLNAHRVGTVTSTGQLLDDNVGFIETLEEARKKAKQVINKKANKADFIRRGTGIGSMWYGIGNTGSANPSSAFIEVLPDATVNLMIGCADIGQGSTTAIAQIVAEEMGLPYESINVHTADTLTTPECGATGASRQTFVTGIAAQKAARQAKDVLRKVASELLSIEPDEVVFKDGIVSSITDDKNKITYKELMKNAVLKGEIPVGAGAYNPSIVPVDPETNKGEPYEVYSYATAIAEVEVNIETGIISLINVISAHDVGTVVNPTMAEGQIEGGVVMGQGFALTEKVETTKGLITNLNFSKYLIPTSVDAPNIYPLLIETNSKKGPYGAKGIGEPALIPTIPAIVDAVEDAIGIRFNSLPITPENVLAALKKKTY